MTNPFKAHRHLYLILVNEDHASPSPAGLESPWVARSPSVAVTSDAS
jgi:hypothetical protein